MDLNGIIRGISIWAIPVVFAVVLHEVSHGWVASKLGDDTARWLGRLTLNPIKHIDPLGTVLIPLLLLVSAYYAHTHPIIFGYAKPVPIDYRKLRNPKRDMVWVAAAGPVTNLLLALISAVLLYVVVRLPAAADWVAHPMALMCVASIWINIVLCIFNMLPLPPLDGGRVAVGLLPGRAAYQLSRIEPYGFLIIVVLLMTGLLQSLIGPFVQHFAQLLIGWAVPNQF